MFIQSSFHDLFKPELISRIKDSELSQVISSSILLINSFIKYHKENKPNLNGLIKLNENLKHIYILFEKAINQGNINNLIIERQQLYELNRIISRDFADCCTNEMLPNKKLKNRIDKLKWIQLIFDHNEHFILQFNQTIGEGSYCYRSASIIMLKHTLELPWEQFCNLVKPLILNFYGSIDHLDFKFKENGFIYSSKMILHFLDQKNGSPKELVNNIYCFFGNVLKRTTQAALRSLLNYGEEIPFPVIINYKDNDLRCWELTNKILSSQISYANYTSDELYDALKFLEWNYQGKTSQFLIEQQKMIEALSFDQPGIKKISHHILDLPFEIFKLKINTLLSFYKRTDQKFQIIKINLILSRFSLKILLNSEFPPNDYRTIRHSFRVLSGSEIYNISFDLFLRVFYPSIHINPSKKIHLNEIINNKSSSSIIPEYKTTYSSRVIENAINFWKNEKIELMSPQENFDLVSLFSRAQIECQEIEDAVRTTQLSKENWKNMFVKWHVDMNQF
ncbi:MAG: hypothetical protein Q8K60_00280 [Parachlamydiaceae bacterium]|nr:hypothetical protein [Parachlamydiaceae bacterium]